MLKLSVNLSSHTVSIILYSNLCYQFKSFLKSHCLHFSTKTYLRGTEVKSQLVTKFLSRFLCCPSCIPEKLLPKHDESMWHAGWEPVLLCLQTEAHEVLKTEKREDMQFIFVHCFDLGKRALRNHI